MRADLRRTAGIVLLTGAVVASPMTAQAHSASGPVSARSGTESRSQSEPPRFPAPLQPTSRFFPLRPGTRYVYEGVVKDADGSHRHRIVFTVTDLVKRIGGVNARVMLDNDFTDGVLAESELAFFSKDNVGNIWTRGEYPEEYDNGEFVGAPSAWVTGVRGARAGILVPGHPRAGTPPFVQGRAPAVGFFDVGRVTRTGLRVCVPSGCYRNVVEVRESAPNAPEDGIQLKYYAPHVGLVKIDARGGDAQEVMTLRSVTRLGPTALKEARNAALRLDRRAYRFAPDFRSTPPAHVGVRSDDDHGDD